jgi:hypothetical protein
MKIMVVHWSSWHLTRELLRTGSPKEGAGDQPTRTEGCTPSKPKAELMGPAGREVLFTKVIRHRRHTPSEEKKWQYACRLFEMSSLKEGEI